MEAYLVCTLLLRDFWGHETIFLCRLGDQGGVSMLGGVCGVQNW